MTNEKQKIAERIRKLFALGESANQHEAELAMKKASELMQEYQIAASDIDLAEDGAVTQEDYFLEEGFKMVNSIYRLAVACAALYDGQSSKRSGNHDGRIRLRFYGTANDIAAMKMTFNHLYQSWKSIVKHDLLTAKEQSFFPISTITFKSSHMYGYAMALHRRALELAEARMATVKTATGRDLVVVKGAALSDYMENVKLRTANSRANLCAAGYAAGHERGNSAVLGGGIGSGTATLAIAKRL